MIQITFGDNINRSVAFANPTDTIRDFIVANNFDTGSRSITLQGVTLTEADLDQTFAAKGVTERASLLAIARKENAKYPGGSTPPTLVGGLKPPQTFKSEIN